MKSSTITLFLVLFSFSISALAQVKHLVFDVEGVLVQGIPEKNYKAFSNKDQMLSIESKYYYILPYISHLLHHYQSKDNIVIHFVSEKNSKTALKILSKIVIPKPIDKSVSEFLEDNTVNKLFSSEDLVEGKIDLRFFSSDLKNIIFISGRKDILVAGQEKNILQVPVHYYFETYDQARKERETLTTKGHIADHDSFLPKTEVEWRNVQNKSAYIYYVLKKAAVETSGALRETLGKTQIDMTIAVDKGLQVAKRSFQEKVVMFKYNTKKTQVLGCGLYNSYLEKFVSTLNLEDCLKEYSTSYKFILDELNEKLVGCAEVETAYEATVREASMKLCSEGNEGHFSYLWKGKEQKSCSRYYKEKYFVQVADKDKCSDAYLVTENGEKVVRYYFLVDGKLESFVPEIINLKDWETVPAEVFAKYDSRLIASSLIESIYRRRDKVEVKNPDYDFMNDSKIFMAFNYSLINKIMEGGFLNQHIIGSSEGRYDPEYRAKNENTFLNLYLEKKYQRGKTVANNVRPKFAFLILTKFRKDMGLTQVDPNYGNMFAKFKDQVKVRSTFYHGNSLGIADKVGNVHTFRYKSEKVTKITTSSEPYWETEMWGELTKDDVEYFLVNCPGVSPIKTTDIEKAKSYGIPVFQCQVDFGYGDKTITNLYKGNEL